MIKDFGKRIAEIRKNLKLTQSQFAELVHLSEDSIGKIERGVSLPALDTLEKISEGVKIPISELLQEKAPAKSQNKALEDLMKYLKTKKPEDIKLLHQIAVLFFEKRT